MTGTLDHKQKTRRAADNIYDRYPWFATLMASLTVKPTLFVPTAATDGENLYYNPTLINQLTIAEVTDIWLHELGHLFLGHHMRFSGRAVSEWNVAADLALNDYVLKQYDQSGWIRQNALFPGEKDFAQLPKNKDAEFYYREVEKMPKPQGGKGGEGQGEGQEGGQGYGSWIWIWKDKDAKPEQGQGSAQDGEQPSMGNNSPGNGGLPQSIGDILPHKSSEGTPAEQREAEQAWQQQVAQGINNAKSCGNVPGWLEELANTVYAKKSEVNWKMLLRRFLLKHSPTRFSYARPSRRASYRKDVILPARWAREAAPGVILVDTSGSMSEPEMNAAFREIEAILQAYQKCEVTIRQVDTRLLPDVYKFTRYDFPLRVNFTWKGRGGTDLSDAILEVAKDPTFKWMAVLSDMCWNVQGATDPRKPLIWLMTQDPTYGGEPTFGVKCRVRAATPED